MKNNLLILIIAAFFLISCINHKAIKNIEPVLIGEYHKEFENHLIHSLTLKKDSTFTYSIKGGGVFNSESKCSGKWQVIDNQLILNCNQEDLLNQLSSGYMSIRSYKIKIISPKLLEIDGIKLKKK